MTTSFTKVLGVILILLITTASFAQVPTRFYSQNPSPNDRELNKVFMVNAQVGYLSGYGTLLRTTNGGNDWLTMSSATLWVEDIYFKNPTQGVVLSSTKALYTNDGGNTWAETSSPISGGVSMAFADNLFGLSVSNSAWCRTFDGGITWDTLTRPAIDGTGCQKVVFADQNTAYFSGYNGIVYKTANRGQSWSTFTLPGCTNMEVRNSYARGNTVYFLATGNMASPVLLKSTDGGETFNTIPLPDTTISSLWFSDAENGYFTANNGKLFQYAASSFIPRHLDITQNIIAVAFGDIAHGVLLTNTGSERQSIYIIQNYGGSWELKTTVATKKAIKRAFYVDINKGWVVGGEGLIMRTTNGGYNWEVQNSNTTSPLFDLYFIDDKTGYAVGDNGIILKTTDAGEAWVQNASLGSHLYSVYFTSRQVGYCGGAGGVLFKTTNAGVTWNPLVSGLTHIARISFPGSNVGYAGGMGIAKTTDGGDTWTPVLSSSVRVYDLKFTDINTGFYGSIYNLSKTTDGGASWNISAAVPGYYMYSVSFSDENNGCAIGPYNLGPAWMLLRTSNGGQSWSNSYAQLHTYPYGIFLCYQIDSKNVLIGTERGYIARTIEDTIVAQGNTVYGTPGETVDIKFAIHFPRLYTACAAELYLSYDTNRTQFVDYDLGGTLAGSAGWSVYTNKTGTGLKVGTIGAIDISKGGDLLKFRMKIKAGASGVIPINIDSIVFNTGTLFVRKSNAKIIVDQVVYGDVDLNGIVQAYDGSMVLKYLAGLVPLNSQQMNNADATGDGTISALDAAVIVRYVIGEITSLPYGGTLAAHGMPDMRNLELSGSAVFELPVNINNASNIYSVEGRVSYDPQAFEFKGMILAGAFAGFTLEVKDLGGAIQFAAASVDSVTIPSGLLGLLRFQPKPGFEASSVKIQEMRINENPVMINAASSVIKIVTGVVTDGSLPLSFAVRQNYPNPFNPSTIIQFELPQSAVVKLEIFNLLGQKVIELAEGEYKAGYYSKEFNASQLPSGLFISRLTAVNGSGAVIYQKSISMLLLK